MANENLKRQMVIKLGTTTNEEAGLISNMVDNAAGGGDTPQADLDIQFTVDPSTMQIATATPSFTEVAEIAKRIMPSAHLYANVKVMVGEMTAMDRVMLVAGTINASQEFISFDFVPTGVIKLNLENAIPTDSGLKFEIEYTSINGWTESAMPSPTPGLYVLNCPAAD